MMLALARVTVVYKMETILGAFEFGVPGDSARKGPIEATSEYVGSIFMLNR